MKKLSTFFMEVDEKYSIKVFNDMDLKNPDTIISVNALGKVRKLKIDPVTNYNWHMAFFIFFEILGKIAYFFTKKVVLSDNYQKYWVNKGSYFPEKEE